MTTNFDHFRKIINDRIPLVFFDRVCDELETDKVIIDDETGAYAAVEHLINIGCRNIVHLAGPPNVNIGLNRKNGYIRALKEHNMKVLDRNIVNCDTSGDAWKIIPELFERSDRPDGIFAVNDLTAAEAMKIIKHKGYKVPDDVAIVGFTSGMISDLTDPSLTSVEQHGYIIGKEAVNLLIKRIEGIKELPFQTRIIKTELVVKDSTRRP